MLSNLDVQLFEWVNADLSNPFFDFIMPWIREKKFWIPLYIGMVVFLIYRYKRKGLWIILLAILSVSAADLTSNYGFKKNFRRIRPCNAEISIPVIERVPCGSGYSFTSNHAANHFALAMFLWLLFRDKGRWVGPVLFSWAASIAFAQVYVGLHYPFDVFAGGLLGMFLAWIVYRLSRSFLDLST